MSYQGPATIIGDGTEFEADIELRADLSEPLQSWGGSGTVSVAVPPPILLGLVTIRLPNGREANAHIEINWRVGATHAPLEIRGTGTPPFDVPTA